MAIKLTPTHAIGEFVFGTKHKTSPQGLVLVGHYKRKDVDGDVEEITEEEYNASLKDEDTDSDAEGDAGDSSAEGDEGDEGAADDSDEDAEGADTKDSGKNSAPAKTAKKRGKSRR